MVQYGFYAILGIYFLLLLILMILMIAGNKRNSEMMNENYLPRAEYPFRELIGLGLEFLYLTKYSFTSKKDLQKIGLLRGIFGERYGVFRYQINVAERLGYASMLAVAGLLIAPATGEYLLLVVSPVLALVGYALAASRINDVIEEREKALLRQFPNVVSNLALLINSGMDTFNAWENVAQNSEGMIYEEMRKTITDMKTQGASEVQSYINFGTRCGVPRITKFISMMVQNIRKGSDDLTEFLTRESTVCWEEKKNAAKVQGEKAGSKLMIPIFMIMIGILILIIGPLASKIGL